MAARYDIGFLGGGQLARMSIQAAQRMGLRCLSLDPGADTPASQVADSIRGDLSDVAKIASVFSQCDRVTLENEFVLADHIEQAAGSQLVPSIGSLRTIQDKLLQRQALIRAGVPCPRAVALGSNPQEAISDIGFPMVVKTRYGGYDGKGTFTARTPSDLERCKAMWETAKCLAERFVPFRREMAVMVFVSPERRGCFPTMETVQSNHVCDIVKPSGVDASEIALAAVESVGGLGLYGVELFESEDGSFQVNEIAPRPHNSGHYTLDWGGVNQFEQHVRLVMGWPLVEPAGGDACMVNLLGCEASGDLVKAAAAALEVPGAFFHWYGKAESRPGRKMGHINTTGSDCVARALAAREAFWRAWGFA